MTDDARHLDLLATFHYVVGGLLAFFAAFPLIHVGIGVAIDPAYLEVARQRLRDENFEVG